VKIAAVQACLLELDVNAIARTCGAVKLSVQKLDKDAINKTVKTPRAEAESLRIRFDGNFVRGRSCLCIPVKHSIGF